RPRRMAVDHVPRQGHSRVAARAARRAHADARPGRPGGGESCARSDQGSTRSRRHGGERDRGGTFPDPNGPDRAGVDDAENRRSRTMAQWHAPPATQDGRSTRQGEELSMAVATRWWSKTLFYGSIVAFVLIAAGALGTRVGIWPFTIGLLMFAIGAL